MYPDWLSAGTAASIESLESLEGLGSPEYPGRFGCMNRSNRRLGLDNFLDTGRDMLWRWEVVGMRGLQGKRGTVLASTLHEMGLLREAAVPP